VRGGRRGKLPLARYCQGTDWGLKEDLVYEAQETEDVFAQGHGVLGYIRMAAWPQDQDLDPSL
jgi:hypothetical protein